MIIFIRGINTMKHLLLMMLVFCINIAGAADGAEILVTQNISVSSTWTANNTYNLQQQIYVEPGATLVIEAGTVIASDTYLSGALAVCRDAQIYVQGTQDEPVIMTSKADVATWDIDPSHPTGHDPKTGIWREACNEWGNLTIMGNAYIAGDSVPFFDPGNVLAMEGLIGAYPGDPNIMYGGGDDDDDSGSIEYISLRYCGKVIALTNELNSLNMGGIGRETEIHHIDIMSNIDDGIAIWGGTACLNHFNIWNVGDDSFDVVRGWRGRAQFGLAVQGYSVNNLPGSGIADDCFRYNGEGFDWQPYIHSTIYNCTVLGQESYGDHATSFSNEAWVQHRNFIFMDIGDELAYNAGGFVDWIARWNTSYDGFASYNPAQYWAQTQGTLCEISDSVFFNCPNVTWPDYPPINVCPGGLHPGTFPNVGCWGLCLDPPIMTCVRGAPPFYPVVFLDPRPKNDALTSHSAAPSIPEFEPAHYRGAFAYDENWLKGWTTSYAYGLSPDVLSADTDNVSQPTGAVINFSLNAGPDNANRSYLLLGSITGTGPLPIGSVHFPLTWDAFTNIVIGSINTPLFDKFMDQLDQNGRATATMNALQPWPPATVGMIFYFAYIIDNPWDFASNPVSFEVFP